LNSFSSCHICQKSHIWKQ